MAMSVLGAGLGAAALIMALIQPAAPAAPAHSAAPLAPLYTDAQVAAAKTKACGAWKLSSDGLIANMHHGNGQALPDDALGWAYGANVSLAYLSAALWLPKQVDPATPPDLKDAINLFASTAGENAALGLSEDKNNAEQFNNNLNTLNVARLDIERLCQ